MSHSMSNTEKKKLRTRNAKVSPVAQGCPLKWLLREKTAPPSEVAPFSKTAPGWSRFGSTFFSVIVPICWKLVLRPTPICPITISEILDPQICYLFLDQFCKDANMFLNPHRKKLKSKDLGHFWFGYIRMLGNLQLSAHLPNFESL